MSELKDIFDRCETGKGRDGFHTLYEAVIGPRRNEPLQLLEIGIDRGHSIRAWLEWCPHAHITGIDTFERRESEDVPVLLDRRVSWVRCSSVDPPPDGIGPFDFIIDDGCHWHAAQRATFENYWPMLKPGGVYFIEDVFAFDVMTEKERLHPWIQKHPGAWSSEQYAELLEAISVGEVRHHDFRHTGGKGDHYVLEVRRP